jgi:hypothetical protein
LRGFYIEQIKTLIATKRYQEARQILQKLPDDTTKAYWLKEIDHREWYGESRRADDFVNVDPPPEVSPAPQERQMSSTNENSRDSKLQEAERLISLQYYNQARRILDGLAAFSDPVAIEMLEKLNDIEAARNRSARSDDFMNDSPLYQQRQIASTYLLDQTAMVFITQNWHVTSQMMGRVIVEKRKSPPPWLTVGLIFLLGFVGLLINLAIWALMGSEQVFLEAISSQQVRIDSSKFSQVISDPFHALHIAQSVEKGLSVGLMALTLVLTALFWGFIRMNTFRGR